jgi:GNAT superfamily N-acetyltransferase
LNNVEVREVHFDSGIDDFIDAAFRAQSANPCWVAPLRVETQTIFNPRMSPFIRENKVRAFVAFKDSVPVGRIASIVNRAFLEKYDGDIGHFGLIEGIDEPCVFEALLDAAARALREEGLRRMQGPFSFSINHESGLLVEGFEHPHRVRTNHAPPYYAKHIEDAGCRKIVDLLAANCHVAQSDFPARVATLAGKMEIAQAIRTYGLTLASWQTRFPLVLSLYNDAWRENWGSVPVSEAEARTISRMMLPFSKPAWIRIAEWREEPIAIVAQIPDMNEALAGLDGRLLPFGFARLLWRIHGRGTKGTRIPMIGIATRWRGTRVGAVAVSRLLAESIDLARAGGVEDIEISWMLETNRAVLNLVGSLPAKMTRRFRVYDRLI